MNSRQIVRSSKRSNAISLIAVLFLGLTGAVTAQSFRGSVHGSVTTASGVVPGADVIAHNVATGQERQTKTAEDGTFSIPELPAGDYEVRSSGQGFAEVKRLVAVDAGRATEADIYLEQVARRYEEVEVNEAAPVVETSRDILGAVIDQKLVSQLPLNGRDFGKLVALTPGVTVEGSGVAGTEKGFGQFNINGNRDRSNNYLLDGTDNNDPFFNNSALNQAGITGAPASLLPIDAIQEFNLQSQFPAEYGRNSGSVVNVLTKSGTNTFHGSLFGYTRNNIFDARNFFNRKRNADGTANRQSPFRNNQFGASLGGPIVQGKTFFFGAFEGQREAVGSDFVLQVPSVNQRAGARQVALANGLTQINPALEKILDFFPTATGSNGSSGTVAASVLDRNDLNSAIARVDHEFSEKQQFSGRYAFSQSDQIFPLGSLGGFGSGSRIAQFAQKSPTRVQVTSLSLLSTLSPTLLNEIRVGYTRYRTSFSGVDSSLDPNSLGLDFGTGKTGLPEFDFSGVIENLGASAFSIPRGRVSQTYQILDNITLQRRTHTFRFGAEFRRANVNSFNDNLERGLFFFSPSGLDPDPVVDVLANFYLGNAFVSGDVGNTHRVTFNNGIAAFAQDDWRITSRFTLNYGLRWEYFGPLSEKNNLLTNLAADGTLKQVGRGGLDGAWRREFTDFSPRLGFAWNLAGRTVIRAGYGLYYDYVPQNVLIANFTNSAGLITNPAGPVPVLPLTFNQGAFAGSAPGPVLTASTGGAASIFVTPRSFHTPYTQSWNFNIEQGLSDNLGVEIGYVGSRGTHLIRLYDANQTDAAGNFPNPNFQVIDVLAPISYSRYHALQATLRARNSHGVTALASYVYSKSLDDASDGIDFNFASAALPQDSNNLNAEYGPSTFDTRDRFTLALNYSVPVWRSLPKQIGSGWELNTIVSAQSGRPIPIVTSLDNSGRNNFHQRPDLVPGVNPILAHWTPDTGYLNSAAFTQPADGTFGNLRRNQIFGPHYTDVDFSLAKSFPIHDRLNLQLRAELFNVLNHPNFALPNGSVIPTGGTGTAVPLGIISQTPDVAQGNPGLGGGGPRVIQFAARFTF